MQRARHCPQLLVAGTAAVLGAGLIAVNSVPPTLPEMPQPEVHLSGLVSDTAENLSALGARMAADPFPILSQLSENQASYAQMVTSEFNDAMEGVQGIFTGHGPAEGLVNLWPGVMEDLSNGDYVNAFSTLNTEFLFDLLNITQPFFDHTVYGTGEAVDGAMGIPADILRNLADVWEVFSDYGFWKGLSNAFLSPGISALFASSLAMTNMGESLAAGDYSEAFNTLFNLPATVADAYLNGFTPPEWWGAHQLLGLLSERGLVDQLFVRIPQKIADALAIDSPDDPGAAAAVDGLDALSLTDMVTDAASPVDAVDLALDAL